MNVLGLLTDGRAHIFIGHVFGGLTLVAAFFWSGIVCPMSAGAMKCQLELYMCMASVPIALMLAATPFWLCGWLLSSAKNRSVPSYRYGLLMVPFLALVVIWAGTMDILSDTRTICSSS
jgi:hypothetical protein